METVKEKRKRKTKEKRSGLAGSTDAENTGKRKDRCGDGSINRNALYTFNLPKVSR